MKVRAKGASDVWVGYYNHIRRRGGDVFTLQPITRMRKGSDGKEKMVTITAAQQFSERWMEKVPDQAPETRPGHFNKVGRGDARRVKDAEAQPPEAPEATPEGGGDGGETGTDAGQRPLDQSPI